MVNNLYLSSGATSSGVVAVSVDNCCWYIGGVAYADGGVVDAVLLLLLFVLLLLLLLKRPMLMVVGGGSSPALSLIACGLTYPDKRRTFNGVRRCFSSFCVVFVEGVGVVGVVDVPVVDGVSVDAGWLGLCGKFVCSLGSDILALVWRVYVRRVVSGVL